jgi:hypothetical protein
MKEPGPWRMNWNRTPSRQPTRGQEIHGGDEHEAHAMTIDQASGWLG